jgi:small conductance mechanosensitive channel
MVARLDTVLDNINDKIGTDETGKELEKVLPYRRYIDTVGGISLEVTDAHSAWKTVTGWIMSDEGGIYWLINIAKFLAILFIAMFISKLLSRGARKALKHTPSNSQLLNDFIANIIHKVVMLIGLLVALAALDVNVAPIMAMVGAAGFVVAFALQGTLSNFASGLMIMLYRPYDIGDVVDVAGIVGTVESMTLVSTSIVTPDNRMMVVPNNSIWGSIITNVTHSDTRRVDMTFGIGYNDNIEQAENVMKKILSEHPLVLKDPAPSIAITELADSSVNFNCRPWVKTADYWTVYADVTRAVKEAFDKEGISIPYPQIDVHLDPVKS